MNQIAGDENPSVLREIAPESVDLIHMDPPVRTGKRQARPRPTTIRVERGYRTGFGGVRYRTEEATDSLGGSFDGFDDSIGFLRRRTEKAKRIFKPALKSAARKKAAKA